MGSHLTKSLLRKKHKIKILTKSLAKEKNIYQIRNKIQIEQINISNFKKLGTAIKNFKPELIIHLAGNTSHSKSFEKPFDDVDTNSKSTLFILETIRKLNLKCKFVLGSTFIVIGRPKRLPVNEETPCNPTTIYGVNRLSSEYFCKIYNQVFGLDTNIFRITNSYGPNEQIIPKKNAVNFLIYQAFKKGKINIYNDGKFFRDFIFIDDVITGINTILRKGKSGELYWISSGHKILFKNFAKILKKHTNCEISYPSTPDYTKKVDVGNFFVDNSKLKFLGWDPEVSLELGIQKTLKYFETEKL